MIRNGIYQRPPHDRSTSRALSRKKKTANENPNPVSRWVILSLVAVWCFALGIFVGRGTAPLRFDTRTMPPSISLQDDLLALKEEDAKQNEKELEKKVEQFPVDPDIEFHEALKGRENEGSFSPAGQQKKNFGDEIKKKGVPDKEFYQSKTSDEGDLQEDAEKEDMAGPVRDIPRKEKRIPKEESRPDAEPPAEKPPPGTKMKQAAVAKPASTPSPSSETVLTIQISSLRDPEDAERRVQELKNLGFPAYRVSATVEGRGTWYRVRIGHFASRKEAGPMLKRIQREHQNAFLVKATEKTL